MARLKCQQNWSCDISFFHPLLMFLLFFQIVEAFFKKMSSDSEDSSPVDQTSVIRGVPIVFGKGSGVKRLMRQIRERVLVHPESLTRTSVSNRFYANYYRCFTVTLGLAHNVQLERAPSCNEQISLYQNH